MFQVVENLIILQDKCGLVLKISYFGLDLL